MMLVALAGFLIANRRIRARDAVLVAATTALAFESVRNVAIFVAAATPTWIEQLNRLLDRLRASAALAAALRRGRAAATAGPGRGGTATAAAVAAGGDGAAPDAATSVPRRGAPPAVPLAAPPFRSGHRAGAHDGGAARRLGRGPPGPAMTTSPTALSYAENYPVCASAWLRSAPHGLRIFNQYGEGGYLAWSLAGTGDRSSSSATPR